MFLCRINEQIKQMHQLSDESLGIMHPQPRRIKREKKMNVATKLNKYRMAREFI